MVVGRGETGFMPKKSAARSSAQRSKAKSQKSFELVLPASAEPTASEEDAVQDVAQVEATPVSIVDVANTTKATARSNAKVTTVEKPAVAMKKSSAVVTQAKPSEELEDDVAVTVVDSPKGSASARLAARRNGTQRQIRTAALITPEHYGYVRRDLLFIAILAVIMFAVIISLHFVPGIGY